MISADKVQAAVARRSLGYSLQSISSATGISPRQLTTLFSKHEIVKGGVNKEALQRAKSQLFNDKLLAAELKKNLRLSIDAQVTMANAIVDAASKTLEESESLPPERRAKVIASLAAATSSAFSGLHKLHGIDFEEKGNDSLPSLTILRMTDAEIIEIQKEHQQFGSEEQDESDAEIVEEM